jgi:ComF family protein
LQHEQRNPRQSLRLPGYFVTTQVQGLKVPGSRFKMSKKQIIKNTARLFNKVIDSILNIFYPSFCIRCELELKKHERLLCEDCWHRLPQLDEELETITDLKSKYRERIYFTHTLSVWKFDPHLQTIIHHLKYQNFKSLAENIGIFMAEKIKRSGILNNDALLIPVPLHKTRVRERGYNQSELLCKVIAAETGVGYDAKILKRIRYTQSQTKLNAANRSVNVKNAFKVSQREKIAKKTILLVDDVITTGATINACAKELVKNGAKEVIIISAIQA